MATVLTDRQEFLDVQLEQIRIGKEKGLAVEIYAKPEFDWFQMEEIRLGLERSLDVECYADPSISYETMREIRKGLEDGINLTRCRYMKAGVIRQIRKAALSHVNIAKYVEEKYDADQLEQIRIALEKEINIAPYLDPMIWAPSLQEIAKGLEKGLDVNIYAKLAYNWRQMREIRYGMEHRVDYEMYANPLYDWHQMEEIRKGMEYGIDVSTYKSLMYPYKEMRRKRLELMKSYHITPEKKAEVQRHAAASKGDHQFHVNLRDNDMAAYLTVIHGEQTLAEVDVIEALRAHGVTMGYIDSVIHEIVDGKHEKEPVLVAKGDIPRMGKDGWYEYFFRTNPDRKPKTKPDGSVDYQDIDWFETVHEHDKIAYYHSAEDGTDGYTVTGRPMKSKKGRELSMLSGKGFVLGADKKTYYAEVTGIITLEDQYLTISRQLVVDSVTTTTGNILFDGSVYVKGNVEDGASVRAADDIIIDGFVGAAQIICNGKLLVKQGINAGYRGIVRAKKGVISRFFEGAEVQSLGDIEANDCLNSRIRTEGKITIMNTIAGGIAYAERGYILKDAGNHAGLPTELDLGFNPELLAESKKIDHEISAAERQQESLKMSLQDYKIRYRAEVRNTMPMFLKVEKSVYAVEQQLQALYQRKKAMAQELAKIDNSRVEIRGYAYEGLKVDICGNVWKASGQRNVTVYARGSELKVINN